MSKRSTTIRDRHRTIIRRGEPPCHICGLPIDYSLPYLDRGEFVVDHLIPLARGGADALENKAAAHRSCNRIKSDKLDFERVVDRPLATSRAW